MLVQCWELLVLSATHLENSVDAAGLLTLPLGELWPVFVVPLLLITAPCSSTRSLQEA
jgi:hypothetical protein